MKRGIHIQKGSDVGSEYTKFLVVTKAPLALQPSNLSATAGSGGNLFADTYYYALTEIGYNGESKASTEVSATTSGGNLTVNLSWNLAVGYSSYVDYRLYRGTSSGVYDGYFNIPKETTTFSDDGTITLDNSSIAPPILNTVTTVEHELVKLSDIKKITGLFIADYNGVYDTKRSGANYVELYGDCRNVMKSIYIDDVLNQPTWNTGTQAGNEQAKKDIASWT